MTTDSPPVPLSYLIKECHLALSVPLRVFLRDVIADGLPTKTGRQDGWSKDKMQLDMGGGITVEFTNPGWDPDHTDSIEGPGKTLGQDPKTYKGAGVLANLSGSSEGLNYRQEQTVTSTHERKTSLSKEVHWDIGAEQTIGASGYGVSLEAKFTEAFGEKIDTSKEDTEGTSKSVTKDIDYEFPAGKDTLLTLNTQQVRTRAPLTIIGRHLPGLRITTPSQGIAQGGRWASFVNTTHNRGCKLIGGHGWVLEWPIWNDFLTCLNGQNVDWPAVGNFHESCRGDRVLCGTNLVSGNPTQPVPPVREPAVRREHARHSFRWGR